MSFQSGSQGISHQVAERLTWVCKVKRIVAEADYAREQLQYHQKLWRPIEILRERPVIRLAVFKEMKILRYLVKLST